MSGKLIERVIVSGGRRSERWPSDTEQRSGSGQKSDLALAGDGKRTNGGKKNAREISFKGESCT